MRVKIPDDWNGQDWSCYQIQWPNSPQWTAIFLGLLTYATRGRFWDERTGVIKDAQAIGNAIYQANFPFVDCSGDTIHDSGDSGRPATDYWGVFECATDEECCEMSCSIPPGAIAWGDGSADRPVLGQLYTLFCGKWYPIDGEPIGAGDGILPGTYTPPEIDGGGYSTCGMATAVMSLVNQVMTSVWDEIGNFPWDYWGHIKADNPGVHMDAKWILLGVEGAVNVNGADALLGDAYNPDPFDASTWQSVTCLLASWLTQNGITPDNVNGNDLRGFLQNVFASEWGTDLLVNAMFVDTLRGINRESYEEYAIMGASDDTQNCDCPEDIPDYSGLVWFASTYTTPIATGGCSLFSAARQTVQQIRQVHQGGYNANYQELHVVWDLDASASIQELELQMWLEDAISPIPDYFPGKNYDIGSPMPASEYIIPTISTGATSTTVYSPAKNVQRIKWTWDSPINLNTATITFPNKFNPKNQAVTGGPQVFRLLTKILYAGGLR